MRACTRLYLLAIDMEMEPLPGYEYALGDGATATSAWCPT